MTRDTELERAVNALEDLIDNYGLPEGESYFWDEARKVVFDYNANTKTAEDE